MNITGLKQERHEASRYRRELLKKRTKRNSKTITDLSNKISRLNSEIKMKKKSRDQLKTNKKGGLTDVFLVMIFAFVIILISGVMIYISTEVKKELHTQMDNMDIGDGTNNASVVIDNTIGAVGTAYDSLYWVSVFLIFGMIIAVFIGSFMVTTHPVYFIPYFFVCIIAVVVAVPMSNTYETLVNDATIGSTFMGFTGSNWIMANLPIVISIVAFTGGIIMYSRLGKKEEVQYGFT